MVQMSGSLDPATANASSADHVVQFFPRKPVLLGKTGSPFFARLGRQRFQRVARALFSAEVYPPSILFPYFALPCTILTCLCASVWFWQRYCRFGIGAAALQACFRARSCTPSADQCFASITFETQTPRLSAWRWARLDTSFIPNEMALLARCFRADLLQHLGHDHGRSAPAKGGANNDALHENPIFMPLAWKAAFEDTLRRHVQDHIDGLLFGVLLLQHCNSQISEA